ncbi:hypothetical protein [Micromonospora chersina]|uniref:hypothetical protein n=1 Tax=Micromonospora chersina TaxID=47854 RepID=UPI003D8B1EB2
MVTRRLAGLLLRAAARRWPAELRADLVREWDAELHVLAGRGEQWRMLRFAASLATSRAGAPVVDRAVPHRRLRRTAGVLLLAPPACVAVVVLAAVVMRLAFSALDIRVTWATAVQMPLWSGLTAGAGALLALLVTRAARRTLRTGPLATALGVVLPVALTVTAVLAALAGRGEQGLPGTVPGLLLWLALLVPALWGAGILARRGRTPAGLGRRGPRRAGRGRRRGRPGGGLGHPGGPRRAGRGRPARGHGGPGLGPTLAAHLLDRLVAGAAPAHRLGTVPHHRPGARRARLLPGLHPLRGGVRRRRGPAGAGHRTRARARPVTGLNPPADR